MDTVYCLRVYEKVPTPGDSAQNASITNRVFISRGLNYTTYYTAHLNMEKIVFYSRHIQEMHFLHQNYG